MGEAGGGKMKLMAKNSSLMPSFLMPHASCLMPHASSLMPLALLFVACIIALTYNLDKPSTRHRAGGEHVTC